jgi:RimJ/RimL family protein N-acetyltransferase
VQKVLQTSRLVLRPCAEADIALLHQHWTAPEVRRYLWDGRCITTDAVRQFVQSSLASSRQRHYGLWVLQRQPGGEFCGVCGLRDSALVWPELLYSVPVAYWGAGIATESARRVLRHAFTALGLPHIVATVDKPHVASIRVLEKLGFVITDERLIHGNPILYYAVSPERFQDMPNAGG